MAEVCVGKDHLVTKMCRSLLDVTVLDHAGLAFLTLLSDLISQHLDPESFEWAYLRLTLISEYTEAGDLSAAEALCQVFQASAARLYSSGNEFRYHWVHVGAIRLRARICQLQQRFDDAEQFYLNVLSLNDRVYCLPAINYPGILACNQLGSMAEGRQHYARAEKYHYFALEGAMRLSAVDQYDPLLYFQNLERVYLLQNKFEDVLQLHKWGGHVLQYWEERLTDAHPAEPHPTDMHVGTKNSQKLITTRWEPPRRRWHFNLEFESLNYYWGTSSGGRWASDYLIGGSSTP